MPVYDIDPCTDPRWNALVQSDPRSSIFHTLEWLRALRSTYGYSARVLTTSPNNAPLANGIVFCWVKSWLTGLRLVSVPFSDHCEPLVRDEDDLRVLLTEVEKKTAGKLKYAEIRPRSMQITALNGFARCSPYHLHVLSLQDSLDALYSRLHKDCVRRKIRRAERENVIVEQGCSNSMLQQFYTLLLLTRRRHRLPPQPFSWFRNLAHCFGSRLTIRVARIGDRPIASILTLRHKKTIAYKYGCSDSQFHHTGAMPLLFWRIIQEAKSEQLEELDLGRSEISNEGLIQFKDHLGATKTKLIYWRSPSDPPNHTDVRDVTFGFAQGLLSHLPDVLFRLTGEIFYRHAG